MSPNTVVFDQIVVSSRAEAEEIVSSLVGRITGYGCATVADLYDMVGIKSKFTDTNWGWIELKDVTLRNTDHGWLIDLPKPSTFA